MNTKRQFVKIFCMIVSVALIFQLSACGYILYPERRGQKPIGRIDPAIAILDAVGLFFFIIPGVIAFAVDITNGTLYFPSGHPHSPKRTENKHVKVIRINPKELNEKRIQEMIKTHTGLSIRLDQKDIEIYEWDRSENIEAKLTELEKSGYQKN